MVNPELSERKLKYEELSVRVAIEFKKSISPYTTGRTGNTGGENHLMARKLKSYDLLTTSYFPVRPVFPVVFFFLKAIK
jgi:hypothetical protein